MRPSHGGPCIMPLGTGESIASKAREVHGRVSDERRRHSRGSAPGSSASPISPPCLHSRATVPNPFQLKPLVPKDHSTSVARPWPRGSRPCGRQRRGSAPPRPTRGASPALASVSVARQRAPSQSSTPRSVATEVPAHARLAGSPAEAVSAPAPQACECPVEDLDFLLGRLEQLGQRVELSQASQEVCTRLKEACRAEAGSRRSLKPNLDELFARAQVAIADGLKAEAGTLALLYALAKAEEESTSTQSALRGG